MEEGQEGTCLQGGARFGGDKEESLAYRKPDPRVRERSRVGAVEDRELETVRAPAEDLGEDLRGQARSAHAQDDGPVEALGSQSADELLSVGGGRRRLVDGVQPAQTVGDLPVPVLPESPVLGPDPVHGLLAAQPGQGLLGGCGQGLRLAVSGCLKPHQPNVGCSHGRPIVAPAGRLFNHSPPVVSRDLIIPAENPILGAPGSLDREASPGG